MPREHSEIQTQFLAIALKATEQFMNSFPVRFFIRYYFIRLISGCKINLSLNLPILKSVSKVLEV